MNTRVIRLSVATLILAGTFAVTPTAHAAELNSIISVSHGGVTIVEGQTVTRSQLTNTQNYWDTKFTWPNGVANQYAYFVIFRFNTDTIAQ